MEETTETTVDVGMGITAAVGAGVLLHLLPEDINLPEITNVRPFTSKNESEQELEAIQALMRSIEQEGQIEPVVVMPRKDPKEGEPVYDLVAGRRRLKAITLHNLAADEPLRVKAVVGDAIDKISQLFRRAAHENIVREGINAIDFAYNVAEIRKNMKWKAAKDTRKVAEFLGCSEAQITQHEKLLELDPEFQLAIAEGKLTRDGAYALLRVKPNQRKAVYDAAMAAQKGEMGEGAVMTASWELAEGSVVKEGNGSKPAGFVAEPAQGDVEAGEGVAEVAETAGDDPDAKNGVSPKRKSSGKGAAGKGGVQAKHIKAAARVADPDSKQPRSRKEIVEFFEGVQGPVYGYPNGAVHKFVDKFKLWVGGECGDRALETSFAAMVEKAERGTAPKVVAKVKVDAPAKVPAKAKPAKKK